MNALKLLLIGIFGLIVSFRHDFSRCAILAILAVVILIAMKLKSYKNS
ncbi:hypothetical protein [Pseudanabaena sp. PCC 6802]|nr:hypothetical protein [Pseudanabaena sp. PCC 6802]